MMLTLTKKHHLFTHTGCMECFNERILCVILRDRPLCLCHCFETRGFLVSSNNAELFNTAELCQSQSCCQLSLCRQKTYCTQQLIWVLILMFTFIFTSHIIVTVLLFRLRSFLLTCIDANVRAAHMTYIMISFNFFTTRASQP